MTTARRIRTIADWVTIVVFLAAIALPLAGAFLPNPRNAAANDLRLLASPPELRLDRAMLRTFPTRFECFWNDHFGFRGTLIHWLNVAKVRWLRVPTSTYVLLGRASWLFYTPRPAGMDYEGVRPFTTEELNRWQRVLEHRREWLERHNCHYLLFIPPDKQTIYAEYLDPKYRLRHPQSRLDQLLAHLRERHSKVEILDIRQPMLAAKEGERLYHRTDSHWNDRGAFVGYRELVGLLRNWFPAIRPWPRSAFRETTSETKGGDLATMVELSEREREVWLNLTPLSPRRARLATEGVVWPKGVTFPLSATVQRGEPFAKECDDPHLPRAVVFHDSFCEALEPFLSEHFRRIAYLWRDDFHPEVVEGEKPDVVIQEILERKLGFVIPQEFDR